MQNTWQAKTQVKHGERSVQIINLVKGEKREAGKT